MKLGHHDEASTLSQRRVQTTTTETAAAALEREKERERERERQRAATHATDAFSFEKKAFSTFCVGKKRKTRAALRVLLFYPNFPPSVRGSARSFFGSRARPIPIVSNIGYNLSGSLYTSLSLSLFHSCIHIGRRASDVAACTRPTDVGANGRLRIIGSD